MGNVLERIDERRERWIAAQPASDSGFAELPSSCGFDGSGGVVEARRAIVVVSVERVADSRGSTDP